MRIPIPSLPGGPVLLALALVVAAAGLLALGATDVRIVYLAFHLAGLGILYLRAPPAFRGVAPIGLVMTLELVQYTPWGVPDILWVVPGLLMATDLARPARAGLWYGIACAFKQTPWLLAPFLFLWYWHRHRGRVVALPAPNAR